MRRAGIKGEVLVAFVVDSRGGVREPHVVRASHPGFRDEAIAAVSRWKFKPGRMDGKAVNTVMQVPIVFGFEDGSGNTGWSVRRPRKFPDEVPESYRWDEAPELIQFSPPIYPRAAFLEGRKGKVRVVFIVGPDGFVWQTNVDESGDEDLKAAAIAAVQTFRFNPAKKDGERCGAVLSMEFDFKPSKSSDAEVTSEMKRLAKVLKNSPESIVPFGNLDEGFRPLTRQAPAWPYSKRDSTEPITVRVEFIISQRGSVELPQVVGDVDPEMAYAALHAVAGWQFTVPRIEGEPVDVRARIPVVFHPSG